MKEITLTKRKQDAMDAHFALIEHSIVPCSTVGKLCELSLENVLQSLNNYIEVLEIAEKEDA